MDESMLNALLKTYGAPNTVANANRVREFAASNPEILEKRAMGMRGSGLDDNSDILGAQLDKLMQASSSDPQLNAATDRGTWPPGTQPTTPAVAAATKPNAPRKNVEAPRSGAAPNTEPPPGSVPAPAGGNEQQGGWLDKLWPLILGVAAARKPIAEMGNAPDGAKPPATIDPATGKPIPEATYVGPMDRGDVTTSQSGDPRARAYLDAPRDQLTAPNKQVPYVDPRMDPRAAATAGVTAPQPRLADNISDLSRVPTNEPAPTKVTGDPALTEQARKAQLQAEIDAENAANQRLQDQIMQREADKMRTQKLGAAAKAATGRR